MSGCRASVPRPLQGASSRTESKAVAERRPRARRRPRRSRSASPSAAPGASGCEASAARPRRPRSPSGGRRGRPGASSCRPARRRRRGRRPVDAARCATSCDPWSWRYTIPSAARRASAGPCASQAPGTASGRGSSPAASSRARRVGDARVQPDDRRRAIQESAGAGHGHVGAQPLQPALGEPGRQRARGGQPARRIGLRVGSGRRALARQPAQDRVHEPGGRAARADAPGPPTPSPRPGGGTRMWSTW